MGMSLEDWLKYIFNPNGDLTLWQEYFSKIILDDNVYIHLENTQFIKNIIDSSNNKDTGKDLIDFILFTLYFQIPDACSDRDMYVFFKEASIQKEQIKQRMLESIDNIQQGLSKIFHDIEKVYCGGKNPAYLQPYDEDKANRYSKNQEFFSYLVKCTRKNLSELRPLIEKVDPSFETNPKNHNYLLSRKFSFPIGIRNLSLRYIVLCSQIAGLYQAHRQFYTFAYEILKLLPIHILEDTLLDTIDIDSIPKYIKDIDINNPDQKYYTAFSGFFELDEHELILPKIQAWYARKMSNKPYLDFLIKWETNSPIKWS